MKDLNGYTEFINKEDRKVFYKMEDGFSTMTIYIEGTINAPMINLFAILCEIDLFPLWIPDTESSKLIKEVSPLRKSVNLINVLPWPIWKRELFVEAGCYVMKEHQAIGVSLESIRTEEWFGEKLERHPETCIESHMNRGFFCIQYIDEESSRVKAFLNIDPHLGFIPVVLINWLMKNIASSIVDFLKSKAEKLPQEYIDRIETNKEMYDYVRQKIREAVS